MSIESKDSGQVPRLGGQKPRGKTAWLCWGWRHLLPHYFSGSGQKYSSFCSLCVAIGCSFWVANRFVLLFVLETARKPVLGRCSLLWLKYCTYYEACMGKSRRWRIFRRRTILIVSGEGQWPSEGHRDSVSAYTLAGSQASLFVHALYLLFPPVQNSRSQGRSLRKVHAISKCQAAGTMQCIYGVLGRLLWCFLQCNAQRVL